MGRSPCCEKAHTNKGAWTKEEDDRLIAYIRTHGEGCWRSLPKAAGLLRCGKSCRLRWINYLRPDLKRGNFTEEEDELIIKLHSLLAARLPGRTDNEIKNYWNTHIRRKLLNRGIDPMTHRPINEPQPEVKTISFATASVEREEEKAVQVTSSNGFSGKERCPDLNLELRISPPNYQHQNQPLDHQILKTGGRNFTTPTTTTLCFSCSLGILNSEECSCSHGTSSSSSSTGYDFLGLESGVLDYRSLEMK
ncbi:hypothetical protein RHSIM_Rhsim11G0191600 [Rhododendron simsii]|uniref:Uncharacterized protein n=1 Tax=Rhododendron simsii TaxID=118357 RepID=A0A834LAQ1_RHOSS|nr:hypothetical protein RHSIM_Rhsim11G0191600 [Rhododendron simsii]